MRYKSIKTVRRRVIEESPKEEDEQTKQTDAEKTRIDRERRRSERRRICRCGERSRTRDSSRRRRRRKILSQNPFIIFFLEMYYKMPEKHVTEVARQAGRDWCVLPEKERMKYVRLAERERKRRRRMGWTRRRRRR